MANLEKLVHIWFDLDFTLFSPIKYCRLEARIFQEMHSYVATQLGKPLAEVEERYQNLYEDLESHSKVFRHLGLPPEKAREVYDCVNTTSWLKKDKKLVRLFKYLKSINLPYSIYSNSYSQSIERIVDKLGVNPTSFKFKLAGESFPKGLDTIFKKDGFRRMIELSRQADSKISPNQIMYVGDRNLIDMKPAKERGIRTALVWYDAKRIKEYNDERRKRGKQSLPPSYADYDLPTIYSIRPVVESLVR